MSLPSSTTPRDLPPHPVLIAVVVSLAAFMEVLDTTITNVSLPHIAGSLGASQNDSTWVLTSYLVANGIILPLSGWLAGVMGRKSFFMMCIVGFTVASFACGMATSLPMLIVFRLLQGMAGGGLQPMQQAIVMDAFPPSKRGVAFAITGITMVVAPILGPTLGGFITDNYSWRWIFFMNVPVGILAVLLVKSLVVDPLHAKAKGLISVDYIGLGLLAIGLGALQIVLDKGQEDDWFGATWVRWAVTALVTALLLWIWHSWTHPRGLVDLHVLKDRNFRTGCLLIAMLGMAIYITIAILPLYLQEVMGYTAFAAGLAVGPRGVGSFIGSPIVGVLGSRMDPRWLLCLGFIGFGVCALVFGTVNLDIGPYTLLIPITLTGFALSFVFVPLATMATSTIPREEMGNATGLFNMLRNIGGSIGISMATTALIRRAALHQTEIGANLSASNPILQQKSRAIAAYLGHQLGPPSGRAGAMGLINGLMMQQSALMAYVDVFRWTALLAFFCAACAWLFKKPKKHIAPPPGAH